MKKEYNFSGSVKNPYSKKLKKQISIRIEDDTVEYFKKLASEIGIPYQNLMNMYLTECAEQNKRPVVSWKWFSFSEVDSILLNQGGEDQNIGLPHFNSLIIISSLQMCTNRLID